MDERHEHNVLIILYHVVVVITSVASSWWWTHQSQLACPPRASDPSSGQLFLHEKTPHLTYTHATFTGSNEQRKPCPSSSSPTSCRPPKRYAVCEAKWLLLCLARFPPSRSPSRYSAAKEPSFHSNNHHTHTHTQPTKIRTVPMARGKGATLFPCSPSRYSAAKEPHPSSHSYTHPTYTHLTEGRRQWQVRERRRAGRIDAQG